MGIISHGETDIGRKRSTNQDSICMVPKSRLFAVADGMGGHNGGDIASQMAVKLFSESLSEETRPSDVAKYLSKTITYINQSIYEHGQANQELKGMGTTISAYMLDNKYAYFANVGDSRVYMIHDGMIFQMTRDHSLVQEKLNLKIYDREGARKDPQKNVLIRTIGFEPNVEVDIYKFRLLRNTIFMVCSDGLHGKICDADVLRIIKHNIPDISKADNRQVSNAVNHLIQQANHNGGQDNISVILTAIK